MRQYFTHIAPYQFINDHRGSQSVARYAQCILDIIIYITA